MREVILKMSMSLDGFVGDPDGGNRWMFGGDDVAKRWSVGIIGDAGLHIMGRRTFLGMAGHWPGATDMFAPAMNRIPKTVFTRGDASGLMREVAEVTARQSALPQPGAESWSRPHVATGDLSDEIAALKAVPGGPIVAHGGAGFARSLIAAGLVDRFVLLVHPTARGAGLSLFSDLPAPLSLTLESATPFPGGAVAQVYRPAPPA